MFQMKIFLFLIITKIYIPSGFKLKIKYHILIQKQSKSSHLEKMTYKLATRNIIKLCIMINQN